MNAGDRLRELAERLPQGGSVTLTRDGLLELASGEGGQVEQVIGTDLTVGEVSERFHRSVSTVREWCERGRFEGAYKLNGRDWRIPVQALNKFLAGQRAESSVSELRAWRSVRKRKSVVGS